MQRRHFLNTTAVAAGVFPGLLPYSFSSPIMNPIPKGLRILFQGDSITDAGRDRGDYYANSGKGMGGGYVYQIVAELLGSYPLSDLKCFNRGISGNKVYQLADRWDLDCLAIKPDVLSILIGVNDFWHMINGNYAGTLEIYANDFRKLLKQTKEVFPDLKLIIGEPFAVAGGRAIDEKWKSFSEYRMAAKEIAVEFSAEFIPFHTIFEKALAEASVDYWCPDGVHPSIAGAHLMKKAWLEAFGRLNF
ncbi:MAG: SGNH/GDSL hydrolase family protein [Saprospiraceae bacterium]|nr:SGNH/GDSL hydrolase family protein [Saprospiraceae bacterium]